MATQTTSAKPAKPTLSITTYPNIPTLGTPTISGLGEPYVSRTAAKLDRLLGKALTYTPAVSFSAYMDMNEDGVRRRIWPAFEVAKKALKEEGEKGEEKGQACKGKGKGKVEENEPFPEYDEAIAFEDIDE